jgi:hypothetical protein
MVNSFDPVTVKSRCSWVIAYRRVLIVKWETYGAIKSASLKLFQPQAVCRLNSPAFGRHSYFIGLVTRGWYGECAKEWL